MMGNNRVHEYDPVIYPTRLWVTACTDTDKLRKSFIFLTDDDEECEERITIESNTIARTLSVADRKSGWMGCLVIIAMRDKCNTGIIAHESTHCTDWLCDHLGVSGFSFMEGEARAYYTQWVADCIEGFLKDGV